MNASKHGRWMGVLLLATHVAVAEEVSIRGFEETYAEYAEKFDKNPSNLEVNFQLGLAALETGRYHEAEAAFERVLFQRPDDSRTRLELGRTYFLAGSYSQAQKEFAAVLETHPPQPVEDKIRRYLKEIDRRQSRMVLDGVVAAALQYDTNVKNAHGTDAYDVYVGEESVTVKGDEEASDTSHREFAVLRYQNDIGRKGGAFVGASATALNQSYFSEDDVNLVYLGADVAAGYYLGRARVYVPLRYERLWYGGDDYLAVTGIVPTVTMGLDNGLTLFAEAGYRALAPDVVHVAKG